MVVYLFTDFFLLSPILLYFEVSSNIGSSFGIFLVLFDDFKPGDTFSYRLGLNWVILSLTLLAGSAPLIIIYLPEFIFKVA